MGRPSHQPTADTRRLVEQHAAVGTPREQIAKLLKIAPHTLKRHYGVELELGLAQANAVVASTLFAAAKRGNITAAIFWMKTRAGWRETTKLEHAGTPGEPIEIRPALADLTPQERDALRPILERRLAEAARRPGEAGSN